MLPGRHQAVVIDPQPPTAAPMEKLSLKDRLFKMRDNRKAQPPASVASPSSSSAYQLGSQPHPNFKSGFVTILGNPNVGKSSVLNFFLRQKLSIVSPKPQTTRHRIFGVLTEADHQIIFSDTPGMLAPKYTLQETMQKAVRSAMGEGDVVMLLTDPFSDVPLDPKIMERLNVTKQPVVVVVNKIDLFKFTPSSPAATSIAYMHLTQRKVMRWWQSQLPAAQVLAISALTGQGMDELKTTLSSHLPIGPLYYPLNAITDRSERFFSAEIVRECILELFNDEIPYSCEVVIDSFKDKFPALSEIQARIVVSRESQLGIILGKAGCMLKALGHKARLKLEDFLNRKVFLKIFVAVDENWRSKVTSLTKYGYIQPKD